MQNNLRNFLPICPFAFSIKETQVGNYVLFVVAC
jgi:hypothetical protein